MSYYLWMTLLLIPVALLLVIGPTLLIFLSPQKRTVTDKDLIYRDRYLEIYPEYMILNGFYLGPIGRKRVWFKNIREIRLLSLNIWKGSYRIQGTGDFKTWFAHDLNRASAQKAFVIHRSHKWWRIGFGVEDFGKVAAIFQSKGLLTQAFEPRLFQTKVEAPGTEPS